MTDALGDGDRLLAGEVMPGALVLVEDTPGGIILADPAARDRPSRFEVVTNVERKPACGGSGECVVLSFGDGPGMSVHVFDDRPLWATEPF